jgi:hypothetical protein
MGVPAGRLTTVEGGIHVVVGSPQGAAQAPVQREGGQDDDVEVGGCVHGAWQGRSLPEGGEREHQHTDDEQTECLGSSALTGQGPSLACPSGRKAPSAAEPCRRSRA